MFIFFGGIAKIGETSKFNNARSPNNNTGGRIALVRPQFKEFGLL
jgi:hypothetical protein